MGGSRVIQKVLIANNGIGAVKAIISIRRWAYETLDNEHAVPYKELALHEFYQSADPICCNGNPGRFES